MMKPIATIIALLLAAIGGAILFSQGDDAVPFAVAPAGDAAPADPAAVAAAPAAIAFSLPDVAGTLRDSSEWNGKARLINFWATWCAPCRREIPLLKKTQEAHGANNVQVIGIAVDFAEDVAAYAEEAAFNYPVLVGQEEAMAIAEESGINFIGLPFTMIVAPNGELLRAHIGEIVESHIDLILDVFARLDRGDLDIAAARAVLSEL